MTPSTTLTPERMNAALRATGVDPERVARERTAKAAAATRAKAVAKRKKAAARAR